MTWYLAALLGLVQGVAEFFPISSSGHLILVSSLIGGFTDPLYFDLMLHIGTDLALIVVFYKDLGEIIKAFVLDLKVYKHNIAKYSQYSKLGLYIFIGCLPAVLLGILIGPFIELTFRGVVPVIIFLSLGTILLVFAERAHKALQSQLTYKKALLIGIFQSLALFPGFSRSGATISGGMLLGLSREQSARFSFLMSIPIVIAASVYTFVKSWPELINADPLISIVGLVVSFISALFCIRFLLQFLKSQTLYPFIVYRMFLIGFLIVYTLLL